jgi:hypothetical protein
MATGTGTCSVAIAIPIYLPTIDGLELFSLQYSLNKLDANREIYFVCPKSLKSEFYSNLFPTAKFAIFDDCHFQSIIDYSQLLLTHEFYEKFSAYEFILLYQTDALILRDELDYWSNQEYDYIGAPWYPAQLAFTKTLNDDYYKKQDKIIRYYVGNGGLSLRRIKKCIELMDEFPEAAANMGERIIIEDRFFSIFGLLSNNFSIPNKLIASRFSLEMSPDFYYELNSNHLPMGCHAWWKYNPGFWLNMLGSELEPARELVLNAIEAGLSPR